MTLRDDYLEEMPGRRPIDDAMAEELFAGRPVPTDLEPLATALRALREVSRQAVPPSAELAARMAAGTVAVSPVRPGWAAGGQLPRTAWRIAVALVAAVGRASLAAKFAAAGVVVAVLGVGSAGFAGSLPDPVQERFETVVESVLPYQFPERVSDPAVPTGPETGPGRAGPGGGRPGGGSPAGNGTGQGSQDRPPASPGERGDQARPDTHDQGGAGQAGDRAREGAGPAGYPPVVPPGLPQELPGPPPHETSGRPLVEPPGGSPQPPAPGR